jgi:glycosyltransferase involved in cell wall biosynthesis
VRILFVTQMWPGPADPDHGSFLVPVTRELEALGHEVDVVAIDRRGGSRTKYARLTREAIAAARRRRPDVVFAHFLFPAGAAGALAARAARAPVVVMAHGQDVANLGRIRGVAAATRWVVRRAAGVIANSRWLADRLAEHVPAASAKLEIADCGVDLGAFAPQPAADPRRELGWDGDGPAFLCVGSLIERKNTVRLADAFERLGHGRLAFVGDGPLRGALEGRPDVRIAGRIPQSEVVRWIAACDVLCQPSLVEPFGQATLEGMAMERTVVATKVGGPPEFVTPAAGVLTDPHSTEALTGALERASDLPSPNPAGRAAAAEHDVRRQTARMAAVLERAAATLRARP